MIYRTAVIFPNVENLQNFIQQQISNQDTAKISFREK